MFCPICFMWLGGWYNIKIQKGGLIEKLDIQCAFRLIPVAQADYDVDKCFPMGCSLRCKLRAIVAIFFLHWLTQYRTGSDTEDDYL